MNQEEHDFWDKVSQLVTVATPVEIEYRLYYNQLGEIVGRSSTVETLPTDAYIIVSREEYDRYFDYQIVDGRLKKIDRSSGYSVQLTKSNHGYCVVKNHASLLLEPEETYTTTEYYAHRNN